MAVNPDLDRLHPYPFERLAALLQDLTPPADRRPILLSIGEPREPTPAPIREALTAHLDTLARYPTTRGQPDLRQAIATWLTRRFHLSATPGLPGIDPETQILPVNGTREALFALPQALVDRSAAPLVLMPNPFYQIYEGAALLAGAEPRYLNCRAEQGFVPDFAAVDDATWSRCQLLYICTPGNPSGAVLERATLSALIERAHRHDFIILSDECYAELYLDEASPPPGLLEVSAAMGNPGFSRCLVLHSLSKRSSAPGLRSGFVAGDARLIAPFLTYRTYHGCAMSLPVQAASIAAWSDETHVRETRARYRAKFAAVLPLLSQVLEVEQPPAGFYLWPRTPISETELTRRLFAEEHLSVLPGSFLSRLADGEDPGARRLRLALVAPLADCLEAAERIQRCLARL